MKLITDMAKCPHLAVPYLLRQFSEIFTIVKTEFIILIVIRMDLRASFLIMEVDMV